MEEAGKLAAVAREVDLGVVGLAQRGAVDAEADGLRRHRDVELAEHVRALSLAQLPFEIAVIRTVWVRSFLSVT
ncbi:MAG: hypothetical protein M3548_23880 [Actinomycetota bacterium]|nr:hypothetical protein [Actinomycetota bacterium]